MDLQSTSSRRNLILGAGAAAAVAGVALALRRYEPQAVQAAANPVWAQQFETPSGEPLAMARFSGKPLLLNFWATWCPPCVQELPMIDAFWRQHQARGHQVVALAVDQPSAVRRFIAQHPLGFPIGMAGLGGTELAKMLGNAAGGLPYTVFFKADGSIWQQKMGQLAHDDLLQWQTVWGG